MSTVDPKLARRIRSVIQEIIASLAAGGFRTIEAAQDAMCLPFRTFTPDPTAVAIYERLYALYRKPYFALGTRSGPTTPLGDVLPELRSIADLQRANRQS